MGGARGGRAGLQNGHAAGRGCTRAALRERETVRQAGGRDRQHAERTSSNGLAGGSLRGAARAAWPVPASAALVVPARYEVPERRLISGCTCVQARTLNAKTEITCAQARSRCRRTGRRVTTSSCGTCALGTAQTSPSCRHARPAWWTALQAERARSLSHTCQPFCRLGAGAFGSTAVWRALGCRLCMKGIDLGINARRPCAHRPASSSRAVDMPYADGAAWPLLRCRRFCHRRACPSRCPQAAAVRLWAPVAAASRPSCACCSGFTTQASPHGARRHCLR